MIDWRVAEHLAGLVAGEGPPGREPSTKLASLVAASEALVVDYTGLTPTTLLPPPEAVDRPAWVRANLRSIRRLVEPLTDRVGENLGPLRGPARAASGLVVAAEVGVVLGFLGQRVLGQYDLVLLDASVPARLLFVAPNLEQATTRLGADRDDLWTWVALHEVTHAVQFTGVPWLRDHLAGMLRELLDSFDVKVDPKRLARLPARDDLRGLVDAVRDGGLMSVVARPEQRELIDRVQATMALLEGHAEHVMDAVGEAQLPRLPELRSALERRRREQPPLMKLLGRLLGLEMKMRQYALGKAFCDAVVERGGIEALNRAWAAPENVPTAAELEDPGAWLERTAPPAATPA